MISGCSRKISVSLQLLKETGMRIGEAWKLRWIDIDEEQGTVKCRAEKHGNPRIAQIHFHSLRHWKATKMKHQGFDLFDIVAFLGHKSIKNTVVYVHLEKSCYPDGGDDYIAKAVTTQAEKLACIEAGMTYVSSDPDGTMYFRRRK